MTQLRIDSTIARLALAAACLGLIAPTPGLRADDPAEEGWVNLVDNDLSNWVQRGGKANYRVEDGEVVGSSVPNTSNSFLCTKKDYSDFILEVDFKVQEGLNSGVQVRSHAYDEPKTYEWKGKEIKVAADRVHGYQVEIDPSERAWSGGIYDEGRRGWLDDLKDNEAARKAFKPGDWNHFRIECRGDHIQTWINGVPAADLTDSMTHSGFIALQVHGVGDREEPMVVRWRNVKLKEL